MLKLYFLHIGRSLSLLAVGFIATLLYAPETTATTEMSATPPARNWAIRLPDQTQVEFRGELIGDQTSGNVGGMLYPAPNAAGFVAAVIVHGLLNSANRKMQETAEQKQANQVLLPYMGSIGNMRHDELYQQALQASALAGKKRLAVPGEAPSNDWMLVSAPVFSLSQMQDVLVMDSPIAVFDPDKPASPLYEKHLRIISEPIKADDPLIYWSEASGQRLKQHSSKLLAQAITVVTNQSTADVLQPAISAKTIRYLYGKQEKTERAEILAVHCHRALLKTLRGNLLSVPLKQIEPALTDSKSCEQENS